MSIRTANAQFESWLKKELRDQVVEDDLATKHTNMRQDAFTFLRATYWRWAEKILEVCPDLAKALVPSTWNRAHCGTRLP